MENDSPKVRVPKQKRSIEKKKRIMEAAMALFSEKGIHGTTSKEISAQAGVSIGTFYSYFVNKQTLLNDVLEIYLDNHFNQIWKDSPEADMAEGRQLIRHFMENLLLAYDVAPGFHRETHVLRYSDPEVKELYDAETRRELKQIVSVLKRFDHLLQLDDLEAVAVFIHSAAENIAHKIKFMGTIDENRLIEAFTDVLFSFLVKRLTDQE